MRGGRRLFGQIVVHPSSWGSRAPRALSDTNGEREGFFWDNQSERSLGKVWNGSIILLSWRRREFWGPYTYVQKDETHYSGWWTWDYILVELLCLCLESDPLLVLSHLSPSSGLPINPPWMTTLDPSIQSRATTILSSFKTDPLWLLRLSHINKS